MPSFKKSLIVEQFQGNYIKRTIWPQLTIADYAWSLPCCHCFKFSEFGENQNRKSAEQISSVCRRKGDVKLTGY